VRNHVALSRLGHTVRMIARLGDDHWSQLTVDELEREGVQLLEAKELRVDCGARAIAYHLARRGDPIDVPSMATIHRILVRHARRRPATQHRGRLRGFLRIG
jgi:hypothetical protein